MPAIRITISRAVISYAMDGDRVVVSRDESRNLERIENVVVPAHPGYPGQRTIENPAFLAAAMRRLVSLGTQYSDSGNAIETGERMLSTADDEPTPDGLVY